MVKNRGIPLNEEDCKLLVRLSKRWKKSDQELVEKILDGRSTLDERDHISDLVSEFFTSDGIGRDYEPTEIGKIADRLAGRLFDDAGWGEEEET